MPDLTMVLGTKTIVVPQDLLENFQYYEAMFRSSMRVTVDMVTMEDYGFKHRAWELVLCFLTLDVEDLFSVLHLIDFLGPRETPKGQQMLHLAELTIRHLSRLELALNSSMEGLLWAMWAMPPKEALNLFRESLSKEAAEDIIKVSSVEGDLIKRFQEGFGFATIVRNTSY